ncbi:SMI1/KNR4 family protein [Shimazuella sp. AN120528]|uniref:SMI1/KNR4 family protein n=1 Tax=Shimazuella soli TaxID=1892854 RepID=UPI001F115A3D|nr:SMI1/KNR4 family protein [Shimazuella soli]MCH5583800.1 SMI1/KNR4 family protein [Shimazuella soli]
MSIYQQLERVKQKLTLARDADLNFQVFGSSDHQYQVNQPIPKKEIEKFERSNNIKLPEEFRLFLTEIGNGGAGPYYGIIKINPDRSLFYLSQPCKVKRNMSDQEWTELMDKEADGDSEETIFTGMLNIGTQGCTYEMMLVLNGPYRGRIVYIDLDLTKPPFFTYESNFLDWYERWLNEVIKGYQISWFGMNMDGDEQELIHQFELSKDEERKEQVLQSMHKFPSLSAETIHFIEQQSQNNSKVIRNPSLSLLMKHNYEKAKPLLHQLITSEEEHDQLISLQYIYWYAKEHTKNWGKEIKKILTTNKNPEIKRFADYILKSDKRG